MSYQIENVSYIHKGASRPANEGVTLSVSPGECLGLLGPNGAGKTTLVRQMLGMIRPMRGTIFLYGQNIAENPAFVSRHVAYLPQQGFGVLFRHLLVEEILISCSRLCGASKFEALEAAGEIMRQLGIFPLRQSLLADLSGGQRRLTALAATLVQKKSVLILDEPTNDLDPESRRRVWNILSDLRQTRKTTILLITHNALEADRVVDRAAFMDQGKIKACESLAILKAANRRLTMELQMSEMISGTVLERIRSYGDALQKKEGSWSMICRPEELSAIAAVLETYTSKGLSWNLRTRTLEDIYFEINPRQIEMSENWGQSPILQEAMA